MATGSQTAGAGRPVSPEKVVSLLVDSALVAKLMADYPDAEKRLDRAIELSLAWGHDFHRALSEKAALYYLWGKFDRGLQIAHEVIEAGGGKNSESLASAHNTSGNIHLRLCEFDLAEDHFKQALEHYRQMGMEISIGTVINNLANIYNIRGDYSRARDLYLNALEKFEAQNDIFRTSHVLHSLGQITLAIKDNVLARQYLERSLALRSKIQDYRGIVNNLLIQIGILTDEKDFEGARDRLFRADQIIKDHGLTDPHIKVYRDGEAGIFHFTVAEYDQAERCFLGLIGLAEKMGLATFTAGGYSWLGKTKVFRDGRGEGISDILKGAELAESGKLPYELKNAKLYLAECYSRLGQPAQAEDAARSYVEEAVRQGTDQEQAQKEVRTAMAGALSTKT